MQNCGIEAVLGETRTHYSRVRYRKKHCQPNCYRSKEVICRALRDRQTDGTRPSNRGETTSQQQHRHTQAGTAAHTEPAGRAMQRQDEQGTATAAVAPTSWAGTATRRGQLDQRRRHGHGPPDHARAAHARGRQARRGNTAASERSQRAGRGRCDKAGPATGQPKTKS